LKSDGRGSNLAGMNSVPEQFQDEAELDDWMTRPSDALVRFAREIRSPLLVLGAGGKMGPSLAVRAKRAAAAGADLHVIAVSRFSDASARNWLEEHGVETRTADLFDRDALAKLPDAQDLIYLVGTKFGTSREPSRTWAVNALVPDRVCERFPAARIVALSTGNVYPLVSTRSRGSVETDPLTPLGEYPNAAVCRERIFDFHSRRIGTPMTLVRLNYAVDLRYGVLVDVGRRVLAGEPVDVTTGFVNCIWQGDANDMIVRSLSLAETPPRALNLTGSAALSVREIAEEFGRLLGRPARLVGREADTALLSDSSLACRLLGEPPTPINAVLRWTSAWLQSGGRLLDKPTHFEIRDGAF
jgi:nucleoside-diphosphate-sugar epimerase